MENKIQLSAPASHWMQALPLGNGRLGAMLFGGATDERILLNHEWLYRGKGRYRTVEPKVQHLAAIRALFFEGDMLEAGTYANAMLGGQGGVLRRSKQGDGSSPYGHKCRVDPYQPLGHLVLDLQGAAKVDSYRRELDLRDGIATVITESAGTKLRRTCLVHATLPIIAFHICVDGGVALDATLRLTRPDDPECRLAARVQDTTFGLQGCFEEGVEFCALGRIFVKNGSVRAAGDAAEDGLAIDGFSEATILLAASTSHETLYCTDRARDELDAADPDWPNLLERHLQTHRSYYDRVSLDLGGTPEDLPAEERRQRLGENGGDNGLYTLLFNYARYLLVASSRPAGLPANLQGIWNEELRPPWDSDLHHDVNLQMNYWLAEPCDLSECTEPLFDHLERFVPHGRTAARLLYGCDGIFLPIQTDPWGRATPESRGWDVWTGAAAWMAQHMWWHYEYTGDLDFLRQRAYPYLKEVAAFYESYLVRDVHGQLVTVPSQSPENFFQGGTQPVSLCIGATMDFELIHDLLTNLLKASEILELDDDRRPTWRQILDEIPPLQIGRHGQLQEWLEDFEEGEVHHRHLSHLVGLYPGEQITLEDTPELAAAARTSMERRARAGGQAGGWSGAWAACIWARLGDGERALASLQKVVARLEHPNLLNGRAGGSREDLFQIETNFGVAAAAIEILLQSYGGRIKILPALPAAWPEGSFKGLRARGGFRLDATWKNGRPQQIAVRAERSNPCRLVFAGAETATVACDESAVASTYEEGGRSFEAKSEKTYLIRLET